MTDARAGTGRCRRAQETDTVPLGVLVLETLSVSLSAEVEPHELPSDPRVLGEDLLVGAMETPGAVLLVAEIDGGLAAMARITPRDLRHACHVADVQLLVHPEVRRRGLATQLLEAVHREAGREDLRKLTLRIADDDPALRGAVARAGWSQERREALALRRSEVFRDVEVWSLLLGDDAAHGS